MRVNIEDIDAPWLNHTFDVEPKPLPPKALKLLDKGLFDSSLSPADYLAWLAYRKLNKEKETL